jgi:hypothetical protein
LKKVFGKAGGRSIGVHLRFYRPFCARKVARTAVVIAVSAVATMAASVCVWAGQSQTPSADAPVVPDAPTPQIPVAATNPKQKSCPAPKNPDNTPAQNVASAANGPKPDPPAVAPQSASVPCKMTFAQRYDRFVDGPHDKPLTPKDKAWLGLRNVADPINNLTILATSAIAVGSDSHSEYGPGMAGWGKNVGVNFTQGLTGEFVGTFLICSIAHQDPHYHHLSNAKFLHRVGHGVLQVVWTQGDNGKGMLNYANLVGFAVEDEIGNFYVPGRRTDASATALRYVSALAFSPIGNFVNEFVPDVAGHIHVQNVIIQRIINQVARSESPGEP